MDRKTFLKRTLLGAAGVAAGTKGLEAAKEAAETPEQVGFNHLPIEKTNSIAGTMKTVLHKAETRGNANHGWLNSHHTFSFANYYNPERMNFGALRVLNDDIVAPGRGFGTHPHSDMEIISIPLSGALAHKDSMGNAHVIREGEVQVMSAGTGVEHSEFNNSKEEEVRFLQIWLFPRAKGVTPRYDQLLFEETQLKNKLTTVVSPTDDGEGMWLHQDTWFSRGKFDQATTVEYKVNKPGNGVYFFFIDGEGQVAGQALSKRDGFGVWETNSVTIDAHPGTDLLVMEVPMK